MRPVNARSMVAAGVPVLIVSILLTAVGIESRVGAALPPPSALAQRFHRGPGPCLRWLDGSAIPPAETATVAAAMIRASMPREAIALAWRWGQEAEEPKHAASAREEYRAFVLERLSWVDRAWLQTLGRNRIAELGPDEPDAQVIAALARKVPAEQSAELRRVFDAHPGPLLRPEASGLRQALKL